jgi:signal transduction histidine kinase
MIVIGKIENRLTILAITLLIIALLGFLDYKTGEELSFSIFYLIPISLLSLYRGTKVTSILISAFFASILWFLAEYYTREYSNLFFPVWNAFARLVMYSAIGLLLLYLKEKDKRVNLVNSNLKALNEEKNKFIGIAAHDLRSPISGIYSLSDLLINEYKNNVSPKVLELLNLIRTMSNNTIIVLQNLLDVSKIESGKVELKLMTQDYISFIRHQIFLNQILAKHKNISISLQSRIDSIMINFDNHYFSEAIDNFLSNAIKYSYNNSEIIVKISLPDDKHLLTEVIDKGKGIEEGEQQKLFNYFQKTSTRPTGGEISTGLGLAIAKKIITLHNGEIGVKSVLDQGSNFYFTLPIQNNIILDNQQ